MDGFSIAVRETKSKQRIDGRTPVVLLHGMPSAGAAEFIENEAFAVALARAGHICFSVDVRGFGKSDRPAVKMGSARRPAPMVRSIEIARDLDAAANELRKVSGRSKVGIVQWGAPLGIVYAALWPEKVSHLVLCDMVVDLGGDAPAIQPDPGEQGGIADAAQGWQSGDEAIGQGATATLPRRLALHDLAPADGGGHVSDALAMNYAHHIYCRVMIVESGERADIKGEGEGVSPFHSEFIRAREIRVRRPDSRETGADGRLGIVRNGLVGSLAEFLG